jgi:uncharacterized protein (DUF39 family)
MMRQLAVSNDEIYTSIFDYSVSEGPKPVLGQVTYEELRSGKINLNGKWVKTAPLSSLSKARDIAKELKEWILKGEFLLQEPIETFPTDNLLKGLNIYQEGSK